MWGEQQVDDPNIKKSAAADEQRPPKKVETVEQQQEVEEGSCSAKTYNIHKVTRSKVTVQEEYPKKIIAKNSALQLFPR